MQVLTEALAYTGITKGPCAPPLPGISNLSGFLNNKQKWFSLFYMGKLKFFGFGHWCKLFGLARPPPGTNPVYTHEQKCFILLLHFSI